MSLKRFRNIKTNDALNDTKYRDTVNVEARKRGLNPPYDKKSDKARAEQQARVENEKRNK